MDDAEAAYVVAAVDFVARHGRDFLPLYRFDLGTGAWTHTGKPVGYEGFSLEDAFQAGEEPLCRPLPVSIRERLYRSYLEEAESLARDLRVSGPEAEGSFRRSWPPSSSSRSRRIKA